METSFCERGRGAWADTLMGRRLDAEKRWEGKAAAMALSIVSAVGGTCCRLAVGQWHWLGLQDQAARRASGQQGDTSGKQGYRHQQRRVIMVIFRVTSVPTGTQ